MWYYTYFSPVIGDFNKRLGNLHYIVNAGSISQLVQKIKELELTPINRANILNEYQKVLRIIIAVINM